MCFKCPYFRVFIKRMNEICELVLKRNPSNFVNKEQESVFFSPEQTFHIITRSTFTLGHQKDHCDTADVISKYVNSLLQIPSIINWQYSLSNQNQSAIKFHGGEKKKKKQHRRIPSALKRETL